MLKRRSLPFPNTNTISPGPDALDRLQQLGVGAELDQEIGLGRQGELGIPGLVVVGAEGRGAGHADEEVGVAVPVLDLEMGLVDHRRPGLEGTESVAYCCDSPAPPPSLARPHPPPPTATPPAESPPGPPRNRVGTLSPSPRGLPPPRRPEPPPLGGYSLSENTTKGALDSRPGLVPIEVLERRISHLDEALRTFPAAS